MAQYKNTFNVSNLLNHEGDFKVSVEWHFFATSHGEAPSDGLGGTVNRMAARASLQRPIADQITTSSELYEWAKAAIKNIDFEFIRKEQIVETHKRLQKRFNAARKVDGIRSSH